MKSIRHSDSKKQDIINAAMQLFAERGFDGISVKEIGRQAGVTDAALYKHFKSKEELADHVFTIICKEMTAKIDGYRLGEGSFEQRFAMLVHEVLQSHEQDQSGLLMLSHQHLFISPTIIQTRKPVDALTDWINEAIEQGELPKQNARLSAEMLIGAVTQLAVASRQRQLNASLTAMSAEIQRHLYAMIQYSTRSH